ncbi:hypothetical protein AVEN_40302-1 [Araneus ventricosus]|uniref:Uncharacterized protein n=1 Tax=Araneus ventricosus TaxID=182803 RepID=A0A4Y2JEH3_ARAVE|nr:hypothetical protein AVEN_40302-1 [Araneus ventricosus]
MDRMRSGLQRGKEISKPNWLMVARLCPVVCETWVVSALSCYNITFCNNKPRRLVWIIGFTIHILCVESLQFIYLFTQDDTTGSSCTDLPTRRTRCFFLMHTAKDVTIFTLKQNEEK